MTIGIILGGNLNKYLKIKFDNPLFKCYLLAC